MRLSCCGHHAAAAPGGVHTIMVKVLNQEPGFTSASVFSVTSRKGGSLLPPSPGGSEPSIPDAPYGDGHLLVAGAMAVEGLPAFAEVIEPCGGRAALRSRPIEPMRFQAFV